MHRVWSGWRMWGLLAAVTTAVAAWSGAMPAMAQDAPGGQATSTLRGTVTDAATGAAVADAVLRLAGSQVSAVSDAAGSFVLRGMPPGAHTLELRHPDYGEHALDLRVNRGGETFDVAVHLSGAGMSMEVLEATVEETPSARDVLLTENELLVPPADPTRYAGTVVERYRLQQLIGGARDLGDLIVRAIPAVRELEPDPTLDGTRCLQFGSTGPISLTMAPAGCRHPQVYLDGVILSDPSMAYDITSLEGVEWIQAIPAGEAAGDFGGATYGVILVATTGSRGTLFPRGGRRTASTRSTFDWADDPQGHPFLRTFL
ncbi:MAG TPA: carboxypeptidase-like regulatory domain-containing protein, partial [Longimicrobiales bacterium]|nr:carboxypeptidase-like regulatory domain-containing protein [Longimicrobiales bacterium]